MDVALQSDGKIVIAGYAAGTGKDMAVWRYNADGTADTTFGANGIVVHNNAAGGNGDDLAFAVAIQDDGNIVAVGSSKNASSNSDMAVWRLNADGSLDTSFNLDGVYTHDGAAASGTNGNDEGRDIAINSDGKILVSGYSETYPATHMDMVVWQLNTDGTLDTSGFNAAGPKPGLFTHDTSVGKNDKGLGIFVPSGGNITVSGESEITTGTIHMVVWSLLSDGSNLDTNFSSVGYATQNISAAIPPDAINKGNAVLVRSTDNSVLVAGSSAKAADATSSDDLVVWARRSDGSLHGNFGDTNGNYIHNGPASGVDIGHAIAVQSDGKIVVTGQLQNTAGDDDLTIWRLTSTGALDTKAGPRRPGAT